MPDKNCHLISYSLLALMIVAGAFKTRAQAAIYPDTVWVAVTYYDFHAIPAGYPGKLNPDFEFDPGAGGVVTGMIQKTLSADRKPVLLAPVKVSDAHLNQWFRPDGGTGAVFSQDPASGVWRWSNLKSNGRPNEWVGQNYAASDSMANVVIYDSLHFTLVNAASGLYLYRDSSFFPLTGRGFGAEPPASYSIYNWSNTAGNNYSFTMEIHTTFLARPGLNFSFAGDDDTWAFIDDSLRMDLGGIHGTANGSLNLDMLRLTSGQRYPFDFFCAERHVPGSDITITTNILVPPSQINRAIAIPLRAPIEMQGVLTMYDLQGRLVKGPVNVEQSRHSAGAVGSEYWKGLPSGLNIYELKAEGTTRNNVVLGVK